MKYHWEFYYYYYYNEATHWKTINILKQFPHLRGIYWVHIPFISLNIKYYGFPHVSHTQFSKKIMPEYFVGFLDIVREFFLNPIISGIWGKYWGFFPINLISTSYLPNLIFFY